jgi:hypothetical protein
MKFLLFVAIVAPAIVSAQTPIPDPVPVDAEAGRSPIVIERFASTSVEVALGFLHSEQGPLSVTADVFLDGGSLLVPLVKDLPFNPSVPSDPAYLTKGTFTIPFKTSEKPVILRMVFKNGVTSNGKSAVIGNAFVRITPRGALEALLKNRVESSSRPLRLLVFGKSPGLREMLTGWHLSFTDSGTSPPGSAAADTLMIGETDDRSHLPVLTPQSSLFVMSTDPRQDADSEICDYGSTRSTIFRPSGNPDWGNNPRLHRLFATHLAPR